MDNFYLCCLSGAFLQDSYPQEFVLVFDLIFEGSK